MTNRRINVAILGAGHIAESMSRALLGISDEVEMYAVASRSLEKAQAFKDKWGFIKAYGSYGELAMDENIDLVYVATPHSEHYKNAALCISNGRNCLVEKAFCANSLQAKLLVELAKSKNVFLAEAMWTRYMPVMSQIKNMLKEGAIGEISLLESDFSIPISHVERLKNPALCGGALLDLGVYSISVPAMLLDSGIEKVEINCTKYETGVDATEVVTFTYDDGIIARCKASFVDETSNYARVTGSLGSLGFGPINAPQYIKVFNKEGSLIREENISMLVNGYEYEVLAAKAAIINNEKEAWQMPLHETLRIMRWMDYIRGKCDVVYPFETREEITLSQEEAFGAHGGCND